MATRATRAKERRQKQQSRIQQIIAIAVVVLVLIAGGIFIISRNNKLSAEDNPRLEVDPILGNPDAPVTLIEYGAYACPNCRAWHNAGYIEEILAEFGNDINFVFRDFPIISPAYDRMAAELAQCVLDQGNELFWEYHDALYSQVEAGNSKEDLIRVASGVGVDTDALQVCDDMNINVDTVEYDLQRARELSLPGTPSFLVNDKRVFNSSLDAIRNEIIAALAS